MGFINIISLALWIVADVTDIYMARDTTVLPIIHSVWKSCQWSLISLGTMSISLIQSACRNFDDWSHPSCTIAMLKAIEYITSGDMVNIKGTWDHQCKVKFKFNSAAHGNFELYLLTCAESISIVVIDTGVCAQCFRPPASMQVIPAAIWDTSLSNYQWNYYWYLLSNLLLNLWENFCPL